MNRPAIDHTVLSPNGRVSRAARAAALRIEAALLFPPGYWNQPEPTIEQAAQQKAETLMASAARLRDLAARGMSARKFTREADRLEAEARALLGRVV